MTNILNENEVILCTVNENLTNMEIPGWMTELSYFGDFVNLNSITIHEGVRHIQEGAFSGCENLENITILGSETKIDKNAFNGCSGKITIPIDNNGIDPVAFGYSRPKELCVLGDLQKPDNNDGLYRQVNRLYSIRYFAPWDGKTYVDGHEFTSERGWMIDDDNQTIFSLLMDYDEKWGNWYVAESQLVMPDIPNIYSGVFNEFGPEVPLFYSNDVLILPPRLKTVGRELFHVSDAHLFSSIQLPEGLEIIEPMAFFDAGPLNITVPSTVKEIGRSAFCTTCYNLDTIRFKGKVEKISADAITESGELPEGLKIYVPKGLKGYYSEKFSECRGIEGIIEEE